MSCYELTATSTPQPLVQLEGKRSKSWEQRSKVKPAKKSRTQEEGIILIFVAFLFLTAQICFGWQ